MKCSRSYTEERRRRKETEVARRIKGGNEKEGDRSSQHSAFFMVQLSQPYMPTGKTIALPRWTFVGKVKSLLFNMLSRFFIAFLSRSKRLLISWLQSPSTVILEPKKIKAVSVSISFPIYLP